MSIAKVKYVRRGKKTPAIYVQIANGNVYRLNAPLVDGAPRAKLVESIKSAGKIHLKHWVLAQKKGVAA